MLPTLVMLVACVAAAADTTAAAAWPGHTDIPWWNIRLAQEQGRVCKRRELYWASNKLSLQTQVLYKLLCAVNITANQKRTSHQIRNAGWTSANRMVQLSVNRRLQTSCLCRPKFFTSYCVRLTSQQTKRGRVTKLETRAGRARTGWCNSL
ncbi:hypothetical protein J6590_066486 [Homalodisca vitripennis]|nr:hypothetical protein J6590_066486 [Homalodisca vitripennis]